MSKIFRMKEGSPGMSRFPVIEVIGRGHRTFLWVGNEVLDPEVHCYGTLSGKSTLRKLIKELQEAMK